MRSALSMIELIFVIVVIGILAITAYPKLAATREDARLSKLAERVMRGANEVVAYGVSRGVTENYLTDMSDALRVLKEENQGTDTGHKEFKVKAGDVNDCIILKISSAPESLELRYGTSGGSSAMCDRLKKLIDPAVFPIPIGGNKVISE